MIQPGSGTRLLVSVRTAEEAEAALLGGADIIDIKEPSRGPLGRADAATIQAIVQAVSGQRPVTAALGELGDWDGDVPPAGGEGGLWCVKIALAGQATSPWPAALARVRQAVRPLGLVVAAYADAARVRAPAVDDLLAWAIQHQAGGLLIDTAVKDGQSLFDHVTTAELIRWRQACWQAGLWLALAGSLHTKRLTQAVSLKPDVVAVRGAACQGHQRLETVNAQQVRDLADQVQAGR